jgi:beta-galactosidase
VGIRASDLTLGMIPYGVVYLVLPQQDTSTRRRDLTNIRKLGFNMVVLWPPVSRWEADPPGGLAFDSVDEVMDICADLGLKAILELQGQDYNHEALPETLEFMRGTGAGEAEDVAPLNHPEVRKQICAYMGAVAEHFRDHPALLAYDIFNEVHYTSIDEWTIREFVEFLREQYGDIQALNRKWATFFPDFETIADWVPRIKPRTWSSGVAGRDWFRFRPRNFAERLREWGAAIREVHPQAVIVADILGCDTMHNRDGRYGGATDWETAAAVDVHGLSCWANMFNPQWWQKDCYAWPHMWRQQLSAGRGKQVIISELMTPNRSMFPEEHSSMSDHLRLWGYQAFFNGIKGVIYWKYRPFIRGVQVAGRGLTDYEGNPNEFAEQAAVVADFVRRHADELAGLVPDDSGCVVLFDQNTQDLYQTIQGWDPEFYTDAHRGFFRGFWRKGVSPSFLTPEDISGGVPDRVKVIAVPCNVCLTAAAAETLITFVKRGGRLLTEGRFGLIDGDGNLHPRVPGAGAGDAFGVSERRLLSDAADSIPMEGADMDLPDYLQELALDERAQVRLKTAAGRPALVSARCGDGVYVHVPFLLGRKITREVPGAEQVFELAFAAVAEALTPAVRVLSKEGRVDVSILRDEAGNPAIVGLINYEREARTVRLAWDRVPHSVEGDEGYRVDLQGGEMQVALPGRAVAAVFL